MGWNQAPGAESASLLDAACHGHNWGLISKILEIGKRMTHTTVFYISLSFVMQELHILLC